MSRRLVVLSTAAAVADAAADRIVAAARNAIRRRGVFRIALTGGSTPRPVYDRLASTPRVGAVDWSRVEFFWGDERAVPPDSPGSNYGLARTLLLERLPGVRAAAIHPMPATEADLAAAANDYAREIGRSFGVSDGPPPALDLVWLGMGVDGHTASLFPRGRALGERRQWVVAAQGPPPYARRLTLTFPIINAARAVLVVATGADKAPALREVRSSSRLPASRVRARSTLWLVDRAAAGTEGAA